MRKNKFNYAKKFLLEKYVNITKDQIDHEQVREKSWSGLAFLPPTQESQLWDVKGWFS